MGLYALHKDIRHMRTKMTPAVAAMIKRLALQNPSLFQHQIAALLGVNQGRVSEVLRGKRFRHVPPAL